MHSVDISLSKKRFLILKDIIEKVCRSEYLIKIKDIKEVTEELLKIMSAYKPWCTNRISIEAWIVLQLFFILGWAYSQEEDLETKKIIFKMYNELRIIILSSN